jgi:hypothetical protein
VFRLVLPAPRVRGGAASAPPPAVEAVEVAAR